MAARHNPRCPLCGAPTRALTFRDGGAWSCTDCEALTVEAAAARQLLGAIPPPALLEPTAPLPATGEPWAPTAAVERLPRSLPPLEAPRREALRSEAPPAPPPRPVEAPRPAEPPVRPQAETAWAEEVPPRANRPVEVRAAEAREERAARPRPRRRGRKTSAAMMLGLAASIALLVLAIPASLVVYRVARDRAASQRPPVPPAVALAETLGGPAPPVVLPAPEPVPEPEPEPEPVSRPTGGSLVAEGWKLVEVDASRAVEVFDRALRVRPGDPEAQYGLGYSLLQVGDRDGGSRWLCAARGSGGVELRREVQSLLDHHHLTCSP